MDKTPQISITTTQIQESPDLRIKFADDPRNYLQLFTGQRKELPCPFCVFNKLFLLPLYFMCLLQSVLFSLS
jgi:hypothetical protein